MCFINSKIHKCRMVKFTNVVCQTIIVFQRTAKEDFVALSLNKTIYNLYGRFKVTVPIWKTGTVVKSSV